MFWEKIKNRITNKPVENEQATESLKRYEKLLQIRTNALSAEYVYNKELSTIGIISSAITTLTILVPVVITLTLVWAKGTEYENFLNTISYVSSGGLLCLSIASLIFKLEQRREACLIGRRTNIAIGNEAQELIFNADLDPTWFYKFVAEQDAKDQENISNISNSVTQDAYRYTLKKLHPSDSKVVCAVCSASPYIFSKGSCQLCGNTPVNKET
ncbi:mobilome CxxCx(11)CxxC protein [Vibrio parahaemolyticus]|uniref:mobilome CxxCx(11)CxxC protein n=1 Tax=Vibrio parahaemolyticus TaxID=670 RepID=UPI001E53DBF7|nr:mobilome CxxCx(11)CxxC protein [Vibrio parahaemolyticus]